MLYGSGNVTPGFTYGVLLVLITVQERFLMQPLLTLTPVLSLIPSLLILQSSTPFQSIRQPTKPKANKIIQNLDVSNKQGVSTHC